MKFGDALKAMRRELGITQIELANGLNVNVTTVSRWELGQSTPNRSIASVLMEYAREHSASDKCIEKLRKALASASKQKLNCASDGQEMSSEERPALQLKAIMENISGGVSVAVLDEDGNASLAYANEGYYRLFGYTKEQFLTELTSPHEILFPADRDYVSSMMKSVKETHQAATFQYRAYDRAGKIIHIRCSSSIASIDGLGEIVLMSVLTDITAQADAEERLRAQQDRMTALMNATPGGIAVIEVDTDDVQGSMHTTYYNDHFFSFSGYTREEYDALLKGDELHFLFDEDKPLLLKATLEMCEGDKSDVVDCTVRCHTKDGGYRWLMLTGHLAERHGSHCVINVVMVDITVEKEAQDKQRISEEMLRIAAESDSRAMIVYDVKTNSCRVESRTLFSAKMGDVFENIPDSILERGIAAPECAEELKDVFRRIRCGERTFTTSLRLHTGNNEYQWFQCNATTVYDADNMPDHAILVLHNITEQRIKEAVFKKWQQSIETRPLSSYTLFRANLSRDSALEEQNGALLEVNFGPEAASFNDRTKMYADQYVFPDDRESYSKLLNSDALLARFYRGEHAAAMEYREMDGKGGVLWRRLTVEMVEYLNSSDVQAFLMYEDIDERKKAELREKELAETDPLTGALNRVAFTERVNAVLSGEPNAQHALIMMDLDGFKLLNDTFGHAAGDQALVDISAALRSLIREGDFLCRLGGDEFIIWLKDISYDAVIEKKAQKMCELVRKVYSVDVQVTASMGVSVYPRDGHSFDELYRKADKALYNVKQAGKDNFSFFSRADKLAGEDDNEVKPKETTKSKRRILIVDDSESSRDMLSEIFKEDYLIETAKSGTEAMVRLRHFGSAISVVLLDLAMPGMDGYEVLKRMQNSVELRTIPVIVVSANDDYDANLKAIEYGAADYVVKPVDPNLVRLRVQSAISKSENERLRAQNSYLQLQRDEEIKFHTVLESTGTVVIEYDWRNHVFIYDRTISTQIAGEYNARGLWQIFLSDMVADCADVKALQDMMLSLANDRDKKKDTMLVQLKTPKKQKHWFRMNVYKQSDNYGLAEKMIITFNDIHEEVLTNEKLLFQATRDELTGLYNRSGFFEQAEKMIAEHEAGYYVMTCLDIEKFKVINDQYGNEKGDEVLRQFGQVLGRLQNEGGAVCCRMMADIFAVLRPRKLDKDLLMQAHRAAEILDGSLSPLRFCAGRCVVDDKTLSPNAIYDRAAIAKDTVKGRYDIYIATYDEHMRTSILRQQKLTEEMKSALESGQFEVWFQPQYNHSNGTLSGAEALARWRHPEEGIISPSEFVPIFEKNGFIYEMDKFIWERTCVFLRKWLDKGLKPVPISINISRYDIFCKDIVDTIVGLTQKYDIPVEQLRLEITESAFSESSKQIIDVVKQLVELGFVVEIDDFGSGYSSLNTLKDVPAQVIKMDMRFLENDANSMRGGSIIESVVRMAKWLDMSIIAEGVETIEQADFLKSIGCEYVQGFLYARPAKVDDYEELFAMGKIDPCLSTMKALDTWNNNTFWDPKSIESLIFNSYVGAACIFEYYKGDAELLRVNDRYSEEFGLSSFDGKPFNELNPTDYLDDANRKIMFDNIEKAIETDKESTCEVFWSFNEKGQRNTLYVRATTRVIARAGDRVLLYCVINNITTQRLAEQNEHCLTERMQAIMDHSDSGISAVELGNNGEYNYVFFNNRYYELLGYTSQQYAEEVHGPRELILGEDFDKEYDTVRAMKEGDPIKTFEIRVKCRDGQEKWLRAAIAIIKFSDVKNPVQLTSYTDITEVKRRDAELQYLNETMLSLMNNTPGAFVQMSVSPEGVISAVYCNDGYFELVGMDREATRETFKKDVLCGVHPDDVPIVKDTVKKMMTEGEAHNVRCRLRHGKKGYIWALVSGQAARDRKGGIVLNAYYTDATEQVTEEERQIELLDNMPYGAGLYEYCDGQLSVTHLNKRYWELVGRKPDEDMKATFIESVHPDDRAVIMRNIQEAIRNGTDANCVARILSGDNSYRPFYIVGRIVPKDGGYSIYAAHTPTAKLNMNQ